MGKVSSSKTPILLKCEYVIFIIFLNFVNNFFSVINLLWIGIAKYKKKSRVPEDKPLIKS